MPKRRRRYTLGQAPARALELPMALWERAAAEVAHRFAHGHPQPAISAVIRDAWISFRGHDLEPLPLPPDGPRRHLSAVIPDSEPGLPAPAAPLVRAALVAYLDLPFKARRRGLVPYNPRRVSDWRAE